MSRVLKLIQLWHLALVPKSRHRDDLLNITEMYKLLQLKGGRCTQGGHVAQKCRARERDGRTLTVSLPRPPTPRHRGR